MLWTLIGVVTFVALVVSAVGFNYGDDEPPADRRRESTGSVTTIGTASTPSSTDTTAGATT